MLFNIVLFALVLAIAYFHYTQSLFSSAISAMLAILAAMLAIGFHETVAQYVITYLKMPEQADAISLIVIFAAAYAISRLLFDRLCPGNVQFPFLMDKIGSAVFGVIAGLFGTGILALAAESMPFGPDIAGYSRQALGDRPNVTVLNPSTNRGVDTSITQEVTPDGAFQSIPVQPLWFHEDDMVVSFANTVSSSGSSLSWGTPLNTVHPDYPLELFGQRLGVPGGTRHIVAPDPKMAGIRVEHAFALPKVPPHMDAEVHAVRGEHQLPEIPADMTLVVVRSDFLNSTGFTDPADSNLHLSLAGIRLKAGATDYFPLGTMAGGSLLLQNRPDDPLVIDLKNPETVDFLFAVNPDDLIEETKDKVKTRHFKPGTFLEVMRYAQADLSGSEISSDSPATSVQVDTKSETLGGVLRKADVMQEALKKLSVIAAPAAPSSNADAGKNPQPDAKPKADPLQDAPGRFLGL